MSYAEAKEAIARRAAERMAEKQAALAGAVDRDPCLRCGVRADLHEVHGCRRFTA